jgi:hypothetical protein
MSCLLFEVTRYDYIMKLSTIKLKLSPCHMYWGVLFSVETDITCALYNTEITFSFHFFTVHILSQSFIIRNVVYNKSKK